MRTHREKFEAAFTAAIAAAGAELQICLKGTGPMGPGPVRVLDENDYNGVYVITTLASDGRPGGQPIKYPVTFCFDDLLWYSTGPLSDDKPMIVTAGAGGLHVPRGRG